MQITMDSLLLLLSTLQEHMLILNPRNWAKYVYTHILMSSSVMYIALSLIAPIVFSIFLQGEAIAHNLRTMFGLKVPIVSIVMGEGGSGGALAIGCCNKMLMLENAVFYVARYMENMQLLDLMFSLLVH